MADFTIDVSSELMENYIQSDILLPQDKFLALQTETGASLLFSIGSGNAFNLVIEGTGQKYGWRQVNLAATGIGDGIGSAWTLKTFSAAQSQDGTEIHLAAVVDDGQQDHLYISLANSASDLAWTDQPAWTSAPFNAVGGDGMPMAAPNPLKIADVFISEASDGEYIVIDAIRNPGQQPEYLLRFYLDVTTPASPVWTAHDLSTDIEVVGYGSCLGRASKQRVDGLFTKSVAGSAVQLIYTPLYNPYNPRMSPDPARLSLADDFPIDAIAAARNADNTSDLFVTATVDAATGRLYHFASTNQIDNTKAGSVASSALLVDVRSLYACAADGTVTVWGLNGKGQVFYLKCPSSQLDQEASWSTPLPILTGTDAITPYIDRGYGANTFFAHTGAGLVKMVKSPTTGLWSQRNIALAPSATTQAATAIHSYTTHIKVTDANGQPATGLSVSLSATNVTSVYINNLYHIMGPSQIEIATDGLGTITIVEATSSLAGTRFTVSVPSQPLVAHNTMDSAWQRNAQYTTADSLQAAQIVARDGTTRNFIPDGTSQNDLQSVAASNAALASAYANLSAAPASTASVSAVRALTAVRLAPSPRPVATLAVGGFWDDLETDIGDLFSYVASAIEDAVETAVSVVEDAAAGVWRFVVKIGDAGYHAVLDSVEAVVAAATWVYNAIKVAVEDVIEFLQFLFGWQDILVTHKVLKNVFLCLGASVVADVSTLKSSLTQAFGQMQSAVGSWGDIPDVNGSAAATLTQNPPLAMQNSAPANLGVHHFQNNCGSSSSDAQASDPADAIFKDLVAKVGTEGDTLAAAAAAIKAQVIDQFSGLDATDIIKRLLAKLSNALLQTVEDVLATALDVFAQLMEGVIDLLTAKLDIPVLSWLYNQLTGEDLSCLDVICLIAAIPVTVIFKATAGRAPFPADDSFTKGLIEAATFADIQAQFIAPASPLQGALRASSAGPAAAVSYGDAGGAVLDQALLKDFGYVTSIVALIGSIALAVVVNLQRLDDDAGSADPTFERSPKKFSIIAAAANMAYVSPNLATLLNIRTDNWYGQVNNSLTIFSVAKGFASIYAAVRNDSMVSKGFALAETASNMVWNLPVICNIIDNHDDQGTTYRSLVPESIGNFAFNAGGILEFPIAMCADPLDKVPIAAAQAVLMGLYGIFMVAAGRIYSSAPNQAH